MSIVDEVTPEEDKYPVANKTILVDAVPAFVPRTVLKPVLGNVVIGLTTTPDATKMHYAVGDGKFAYHMFFAKSGMSLVDVLAMAYRNVFMWIRPQGYDHIYYDVYQNRTAALANISHVLYDLVGSSVNDLMSAEYHDERFLEINKGEEAFVVDIRRTYDRDHDRITTVIMTLPERYASITADELFEEGITTTIQKTPAFVDPGDFMPGVWTPDPDAE